MRTSEKILAECDPAIRQRAEQERQKCRIARIRSDMPELIAESEDGAQRIRHIVQDMKRFSRMDNADFDYSDINVGLESTLTIAWNDHNISAGKIRSRVP